MLLAADEPWSRHEDLERPHPAPLRLVLGFVLAPLVPAVVFATHQRWARPDIDRFSDDVLIALVFGYPAVLLLGIPAYLALHRFLRPRLATCALVGGCVAALPWFALSIAILRQPPMSRSCDALTFHSWCEHLGALTAPAEAFLLGAIGGVVFWLCTVWRNPGLARADA